MNGNISSSFGHVRGFQKSTNHSLPYLACMSAPSWKYKPILFIIEMYECSFLFLCVSLTCGVGLPTSNNLIIKKKILYGVSGSLCLSWFQTQSRWQPSVSWGQGQPGLRRKTLPHKEKIVQKPRAVGNWWLLGEGRPVFFEGKAAHSWIYGKYWLDLMVGEVGGQGEYVQKSLFKNSQRTNKKKGIFFKVTVTKAIWYSNKQTCKSMEVVQKENVTCMVT